MLSCPSGMSVSSRALNMRAEALRHRHRQRGTRWRRLDSGQQALQVLAYLRKRETYADLAIGFAIGTTTVFRAIREALEVLARPARSGSKRRSRSRHGKRSSSSTAHFSASTEPAWPRVGIARITRENTKDTK